MQQYGSKFESSPEFNSSQNFVVDLSTNRSYFKLSRDFLSLSD